MVTRPVMIVDDDDDAREGLAMMFKLAGWPVCEAADGAAALRLLEEGVRPRVILLDINMSGMDGVGFRKRQRAVPEFAAIPTIVISGDDQHPLRDELPTILKPVDLQTLLVAINALG